MQQAVVTILNQVYETDFLGFSYGFRPGRGQHHALDALSVAIKRNRVNWVLDLDIRGFFDAIDHGWLVKFIEHRIADKRVVRLREVGFDPTERDETIKCNLWGGWPTTPRAGRCSKLIAYTITDACIGWDDSLDVLEILSKAVSARRG